MTLRFRFVSKENVQLRDVEVREAIIAGWTGRNRKAVEAHVEELKALGVPAPSATPLFYRVSASRLTTADAIEACGANSSGEVEFVLLGVDGELWIGAGSDHTDRSVEAYSVAVSKQMCDKPVAQDLWPFREVEDHWDQLVLRSYIESDGTRQLYQEGAVSAILHPLQLIRRYSPDTTPPSTTPLDGSLMLGGTLPAIGGVRPADSFEFELYDPVLGRTIGGKYRIVVLPVVS